MKYVNEVNITATTTFTSDAILSQEELDEMFQKVKIDWPDNLGEKPKFICEVVITKEKV